MWPLLYSYFSKVAIFVELQTCMGSYKVIFSWSHGSSLCRSFCHLRVHAFLYPKSRIFATTTACLGYSCTFKTFVVVSFLLSQGKLYDHMHIDILYNIGYACKYQRTDTHFHHLQLAEASWLYCVDHAPLYLLAT